MNLLCLLHSTSSSGVNRDAKDSVRRCCWQLGCLGTVTIFQWEVVEQFLGGN